MPAKVSVTPVYYPRERSVPLSCIPVNSLHAHYSGYVMLSGTRGYTAGKVAPMSYLNRAQQFQSESKRGIRKSGRGHHQHQHKDSNRTKRQNSTLVSCACVQFTSDLEKYHYFHLPEPEYKNQSEGAVKYESKSNLGGAQSREEPGPSENPASTIRNEPWSWSWSTAYGAFDYWCFYRIEMSKYRLTLYKQHYKRNFPHWNLVLNTNMVQEH